MPDPVVWDRLVRIMRDVFDDDELTVQPGTTAADVEGWDSLSHIELMVALEAAFGIRFNTGEIAGLRNVGDLADVIATRADHDRS